MFHPSPAFLAKLEAKSLTASQLPPEERGFLDAARNGDVEKVRELLAKGVAVDVREDFNMPWEQTALMYAARGGHVEVVRVLLKAGASVSAADKDARDSEGANQPLHHAVAGGNLAVMEELLGAGADANALTTSANTPLNHAIRKNNRAAAELLLKRGAKANFKAGRKKVRSPLIAAVEATWTKVPPSAIGEFVLILLEAGADPNGTGDGNRTALFTLATARDIPNEIAVPLIEALLKAGASADHKDKDGGTPLQSAIHYNNPPAVKLLIEAGADVNRIFSGSNKTALDVAEQTMESCERDLREWLASPESADEKAAERKKQLRAVIEKKTQRCKEVLKILQEHGAKRKAELG